MKIGLLSDTHSHLDERIFKFFDACDEVWHGGDFGDPRLVERLRAFNPNLRGVYGNIDGPAIRAEFPLDLRFECAGLDVFMTHIGGYPGRYAPRVGPILRQKPPKLFISGHSHILKVMNDKSLGLLHINPGACGIEGWHQIKTIIRFDIADARPTNLEVIELGPKNSG